MDLNDCITKILEQFQKDEYFDSHTVINELLQNKEYHLAYLREYNPNDTVAQYHGKIAKMIGNNGVTKIGTMKTHTIYGNLSPNALWQKN